MDKSTPICYLRENDDSNVIIGVVITAEKPNLIPDKYASNPAQKRYALNFCLRDEKKDTINACVWGNIEYVNPLATVCRIGKQVMVINARVRLLEETDEYRPKITSNCKLVLDESNSSTVKPYTPAHFNGGQSVAKALQAAFHTALPSDCEKVNIKELISPKSLYTMDFVDLIAIVVSVSPVVKGQTKEGKWWVRQEIKLTDRSVPVEKFISLMLWDCVQQEYASTWESCKTVLYLSSVKVCQDSYKDRPVLQAVSRSVITKDPLMMDEARHLNNHAATHLSDPEVINSMLEQLEPGDTFDREVAEKLFSLFALQNLMDNMEKGRKQVLLVSVVINKINLRSEICFKAKCGGCGSYIGRYSEQIGSSVCTYQLSCRGKEAEVYFDFFISLIDHTGTINIVRVKGPSAEQILGCNPFRFLELNAEERKGIEDRFFMERCEVGLKLEHYADGKKSLQAIHLKTVTE